LNKKREARCNSGPAIQKTEKDGEVGLQKRGGNLTEPVAIPDVKHKTNGETLIKGKRIG